MTLRVVRSCRTPARLDRARGVSFTRRRADPAGSELHVAASDRHPPRSGEPKPGRAAARSTTGESPGTAAVKSTTRIQAPCSARRAGSARATNAVTVASPLVGGGAGRRRGEAGLGLGSRRWEFSWWVAGLAQPRAHGGWLPQLRRPRRPTVVVGAGAGRCRSRNWIGAVEMWSYAFCWRLGGFRLQAAGEAAVSVWPKMSSTPGEDAVPRLRRPVFGVRRRRHRCLRAAPSRRPGARRPPGAGDVELRAPGGADPAPGPPVGGGWRRRLPGAEALRRRRRPPRLRLPAVQCMSWAPRGGRLGWHRRRPPEPPRRQAPHHNSKLSDLGMRLHLLQLRPDVQQDVGSWWSPSRKLLPPWARRRPWSASSPPISLPPHCGARPEHVLDVDGERRDAPGPLFPARPALTRWTCGNYIGHRGPGVRSSWPRRAPARAWRTRRRRRRRRR